MTYSFSYVCTLEDHKQLEYLLSPIHSKIGKIIFIAFLFLLLIIALYLFYSFLIGNSQPIIIIAEIIFCLIPIIFLIRFVHVNNVIEENYNICHNIGEIIFNISDQKIEVVNKYNSANLPWVDITQVLENDHYFSFYIAKITRISIPKHIITPEAMSMIISKIESYKITRKIIKD